MIKKKLKTITMSFFSREKTQFKSGVCVSSSNDDKLLPERSEHSGTIKCDIPSLRSKQISFSLNRPNVTVNGSSTTSPLASPLTSPRPKNSPPSGTESTTPLPNEAPYSTTGSATPYSDQAEDCRYKAVRFVADMPSIGMDALRLVGPGMGLGGGAFAGHTFTDWAELKGPQATGVQATVAAVGTAIGVGSHNSWVQPRTPPGARSHIPGVFAYNGAGLEFEKAVRNQTPNIESTALTLPVQVTKLGSVCKECDSITPQNVESSVKEEDSNSKSQSAFLSPVTLFCIMQKESLYGETSEIGDDLLPLLGILLSITAEMHKEQIADKALKIKENVFAFFKKQIKLN